MQGLRKVVPLLAVVGVLAVPGAAAAQESSQSAYSQNDTAVVDPAGGDGAGTDAAAAAESAGSTGGALPFTGLDALLIGLAGAALAALGLTMRRVTRSPSNA